MRKPRATRGRRKKKKLNVLEQAQIKALSQTGSTSYAIEQRTGISHHTISKYLEDEEAYADPGMKQLVAKILEHEIEDLVVLQTRARRRLHDIADRMNPIEAIALMDRTFNQRRILEGKSTQNISTLVKIITEANEDLAD